MGFYVRESMNLGGGTRLNFSKPGMGVSADTKGFRLGSGPRGNYIHMGQNGVHYCAALGQKKQHQPKKRKILIRLLMGFKIKTKL